MGNTGFQGRVAVQKGCKRVILAVFLGQDATPPCFMNSQVARPHYLSLQPPPTWLQVQMQLSRAFFWHMGLPYLMAQNPCVLRTG